jgi:predicted ATPase with chaperone activity
VLIVKGVLPIALRAGEQGKVGIRVPPENAAEAGVVAGLQVIPVRNLREAVGFLKGEVKSAVRAWPQRFSALPGSGGF